MEVGDQLEEAVVMEATGHGLELGWRGERERGRFRTNWSRRGLRPDCVQCRRRASSLGKSCFGCIKAETSRRRGQKYNSVCKSGAWSVTEFTR